MDSPHKRPVMRKEFPCHNIIMEHLFSCDANKCSIMYVMHCGLDTDLVSSWLFVLRCGGLRRGGCRAVPGNGPRQGQVVHQLQRAGARVPTRSKTDWRTYRCLQAETGEDPNRNEGSQTVQTTNAREIRLAFVTWDIWPLKAQLYLSITNDMLKKYRVLWSAQIIQFSAIHSGYLTGICAIPITKMPIKEATLKYMEKYDMGSPRATTKQNTTKWCTYKL